MAPFLKTFKDTLSKRKTKSFHQPSEPGSDPPGARLAASSTAPPSSSTPVANLPPSDRVSIPDPIATSDSSASSLAPTPPHDVPRPLGSTPTPAPPSTASRGKGLSSLPLAKSIVHQIASRSTLRIDSLQLLRPSAHGFDAALVLRIGHTGPVQAKLTFPQPLQLVHPARPHHPLAEVALPPLKLRPSAARAGAVVQVVARVSASQPALAELVRELLVSAQPVEYLIRTDAAEVKAYKLRFGAIRFEKLVTLGGLDRLGGAIRFGPDQTGKVEPAPAAAAAAAQRSVRVDGFDIVGGNETGGIELRATVVLQNTSNVAASLGSVTLDLAIPLPPSSASTGTDATVVLGSLRIAELSLQKGENAVEATGTLVISPTEGVRRDVGLATIRNLLEDRPIEIVATAGEGVSPFGWLVEALRGASIRATVPPLGVRARILDGASLVATDRDEGDAGPLLARATLRNGLGPPLHVHALYVEARKETSSPADPTDRKADDGDGDGDGNGAPPASLLLGVIETGGEWPGLVLSGEEPTHASLPFELCSDAASYVEILKHEARVHAVQLPAPLLEALELMPSSASNGVSDRRAGAAAATGPPTRSGDSTAASDEKLDLPELVARILSTLHVSATVRASVSIGAYRIPGEVTFVQRSLPIAITLATARRMLPAVGQPLVETLLSQATVTLGTLEVVEMDQTGLVVDAAIALANFGPLDVEVAFEHGLDVALVEARNGVEPASVVARIEVAEPVRGTVATAGPNGEATRTRLRILPVSGAQGGRYFSTLVAALLQSAEVRVRLSTHRCTILAAGAVFYTALEKEVALLGLDALGELELEGFEICGEVPAPVGAGRGRALSFGATAAAAAAASAGGPGTTSTLSGTTAKPMAYEIRTTVRIRHPGKMCLDLAYIEAGLEWQGYQVGLIGASDVRLRAAPHNVAEIEAHGHIFVGSETMPSGADVEAYGRAALEAIGTLISRFVGGEALDVTVRGYRAFATVPTECRPNGPARAQRSASQSTAGSSTGTAASSGRRRRQVPWLDQAFQAFTTVARLHTAALDPVKRIEVRTLQAQFVKGAPPKVEVRDVEITIRVPIDVGFEIRSVEAELEVGFAGRGSLGRAVVDQTDVRVGSVGTNEGDKGEGDDDDEGEDGTMPPAKRVTLQPSSFTLHTSDEALLSEAVAHIAACTTTDQIQVTGRARAQIATALGGTFWIAVDLGSRPHPLRIQGLQSLRTSPVQYTNLAVVEASAEYLKIVFSLYLHNPSRSVAIAIPGSEITMAAYYRGVYVGRAHLSPGLRLPCGPVAIHDIHFRYCPAAHHEKHVRDLPANFLSGRTTTLEIRGDDQSIDQPILVPALRSIRLQFELKPLIHQTLIDSISITLGVTMLTAQTVDCEFTVNNPLGVPFDLCALSFMASYKSQPFGSCTVQYAEGEPMRVRPGTPQRPGKQTSSAVQVSLAQPVDRVVAAFLQAKGEMFLDVELSARVEVQGFRIPVFDYRQPRLPLHVRGVQGVAGLLRFLPG